MEVFITGIGVASAIGIGVETTLHMLESGITGVEPLNYVDSIHRGIIPVGEVKYTHEELIEIAKLKYNHKVTRTSLLALISAKEALRSAELTDADNRGIKTGIISSSTAGGMRESEQSFRTFLDHETSEDFLDTHDGADSTERLARELHMEDHVMSINTACSSSANAIILGARMINNGYLDRVLVGGSDALSKFTINGFNSMLLLDTEVCKPFDEGRRGINLGEGAGYLLLESEKSLEERMSTPKAILTGYGVANDAYHPSATSPNGKGLQLSMSSAIKEAGLTLKDVDYINAHGTATNNNDVTEGMAMKEVFEQVPAFSSTKAFTGHCLGAAGSIEAIFSILAIQNELLFENLNFKQPIPQHGLIPCYKSRKKVVSHVLSNSAGMGGFCSSLVVSKV